MVRSFSGFEEDGYRVTWKLSPVELHQVHALRADVFCRELGWVGAAEDTTERDEFDASSIHIAVLDERSRVVAAVRLTSWAMPWMLDTVFRELAPPERVAKRVGSMEASRLSVCRRARLARLKNAKRVCDLVYKGAYAYCAVNQIRYLYMVTSDVVLRHMLQAGLPCEPVGAPVRMPDGVNAIAVRLDWSHLSRSPALSEWYESGWRASRPLSAVDESGGSPAPRGRARAKLPNTGVEPVRAPGGAAVVGVAV